MDGPSVQTTLTVRESEHTNDVISLRQMRKGSRGQLHAIDLCCEDCKLLQAMGMTEQCEIRMCRRGSSCIVQVGATRLGVAARLADRILVRPIHTPS
jgi:Fe2+ transport system protein FeoA